MNNYFYFVGIYQSSLLEIINVLIVDKDKDEQISREEIS